METIKNNIPEYIKTPFNNYLNPAHPSDKHDIPFGGSFSVITFGIMQILASMNMSNPRLVLAVKATGISCVGAGITQKSGFLYLPAIAFVSFAVLDSSRLVSLNLKDFFSRNFTLQKPV